MSESNSFEEAVNFVLKHEGKLSDDKDDAGGITNYGISLRFLQKLDIDINNDSLVNRLDIKELSIDEAKQIYKQYFWDAYKYGEIDNPQLSRKILDASVNIGPHNSHILLQKSINTFLPYISLTLDGILGNKTLEYANKYAKSINSMGFSLIEMFILKLINYYLNIIDKNPKFKKYLCGWIARASDR